MKIIETEKSPDLCAENGWTAYHLHLENPLDGRDITSLQNMGDYTYLDHLKKPFLSVKTNHFMIKAFLGDRVIKIGIHPDFRDGIEKVIRMIP